MPPFRELPADFEIFRADSLFMCYCIDIDTGATHKPEVFDVVSEPTLFRFFNLIAPFQFDGGRQPPSNQSRA
jgi:hypothetical protein